MFTKKLVVYLAAMLLLGCRQDTDVSDKAELPETDFSTEEQHELQWPASITNDFGMTFRLIQVTTENWKHLPTYPDRSYYLQETELTYEQHEQFRTAAFGNGTYETIDWTSNSGFPSEWREVYRYAQALSKFDPEYDYRLPSLREWRFACRNGYEQSCPPNPRSSDENVAVKKGVNVFGITGLDDGDYECGDIPGLFFGCHARPDAIVEVPECECDWWCKGNPDGDDGLNELIIGRFVLVRER